MPWIHNTSGSGAVDEAGSEEDELLASDDEYNSTTNTHADGNVDTCAVCEESALVGSMMRCVGFRNCTVVFEIQRRLFTCNTLECR